MAWLGPVGLKLAGTGPKSTVASTFPLAMLATPASR
jgi:hypothetical protein